jgi:hypothetical protein
MPLKFQRVKRAGLRYRDKRHLEADSKPGVRGRVWKNRLARERPDGAGVASVELSGVVPDSADSEFPLGRHFRHARSTSKIGKLRYDSAA